MSMSPTPRTLDLATCINLLVLIDQKTGFQLTFPTQEPVEVDRAQWRGDGRYAEVQRAAKILASSIGLGAYRFIVSVAKQKLSVAAHIELDRHGNDIFIELDPDVFCYPEASFAVLAHELSHKWLFQQGIKLEDRFENEVLTDVASVFLGFGKYCLNGCICGSSTTSTTTSGSVTTHSTLTTGYICRQSFASAYLLMAIRHGASAASIKGGLSTSARDEIKAVQRKFPALVTSERPEPGRFSEKNERLREQIAKQKKELARAEQQLRLLDQSRSVYQSILATYHRKLNSMETDYAAIDGLVIAGKNDYLPLSALECRLDEIANSRSQLEDIVSFNRLSEAATLLSEIRGGAPTAEVVDIRCPVDDCTMRVPNEKSLILVTCPRCAYRFYVTTRTTEVDKRGSKARQLAAVFGRLYGRA
jgi:hypothetical protein